MTAGGNEEKVAEAKKLIEAAGFKNGVDTSFFYSLGAQYGAEYTQVAEIFPGMFTPEEMQPLLADVPRLYAMERPENVREKGSTAVREIQSLPDNGRLFAAHVIHDLWRYTQGKALVVTDVTFFLADRLPGQRAKHRRQPTCT